MTPQFVEFDGEDPAAFVVSMNLARRHLTTSQRAMIAARLSNLAVGSNQHVHRLRHDPVTLEEYSPPLGVAKSLTRVASQRAVAKVLGVGVATVNRDVSNGTPEPKEARKSAPDEPEDVPSGTPEPAASPAWFQRDADPSALARKRRGR